jgi:predicted ATPase
VTAEALALAAEHGLADVQGWAAVWHAWGGDDCSSTLNVMQQSLEAQRRFGSEIARPHQLALVADVMSRTGDTTSALRTIDEALEQAARTGDCYYEAELYRMKGELLQSPGAPADQRRARAIECFNKAIEVARRQGAHLFEKRATANLASI